MGQHRYITMIVTFALIAANVVADELLAVYFLECRKDLLTEWLDLLGLEHEDGTLADDEPTAPADEALQKAIAEYRAKDDDADRAVAMEIVLEGLHQHNQLAREATDAAFLYTDMLATMLKRNGEV